MPQEIRGHLHRPRQKVYPEFPSHDGNIFTTNHLLKPHVNSARFAEDWDDMQQPKHKETPPDPTILAAAGPADPKELHQESLVSLRKDLSPQRGTAATKERGG